MCPRPGPRPPAQVWAPRVCARGRPELVHTRLRGEPGRVHACGGLSLTPGAHRCGCPARPGAPRGARLQDPGGGRPLSGGAGASPGSEEGWLGQEAERSPQGLLRAARLGPGDRRVMRASGLASTVRPGSGVRSAAAQPAAPGCAVKACEPDHSFCRPGWRLNQTLCHRVARPHPPPPSSPSRSVARPGPCPPTGTGCRGVSPPAGTTLPPALISPAQGRALEAQHPAQAGSPGTGGSQGPGLGGGRAGGSLWGEPASPQAGQATWARKTAPGTQPALSGRPPSAGTNL